MDSSERRAAIVQAVRETGFQHVSDLVARLGVSRATIWRDIDRLDRAGEVTKVHGGAAPPAAAAAAGPVPTDLTIGMQVPFGDYFYREVVDGARAMCESRGARLAVVASGYDPEAEHEAISGLVDAGVDGLLLTPGPRRDHPNAGVSPEYLEAIGLPLVLIERELSGLGGPGVASVGTARESGVHRALSHLRDLGHRTVGLITIEPASRLRATITHGFHTAVEELELEAPDGATWDASTPVPAILAELKQAGVTGCVIFTDRLAVSLALQARSKGWAIPGDLSIISYDDELAASALPPLTALSPQRARVGSAAAEMLLDHLTRRRSLDGERLQIEPRLVVRESTTSPA